MWVLKYDFVFSVVDYWFNVKHFFEAGSFGEASGFGVHFSNPKYKSYS